MRDDRHFDSMVLKLVFIAVGFESLSLTMI